MNACRIIRGTARPYYPVRSGHDNTSRRKPVDPAHALKAASAYLPWIPEAIQPVHDGKGSCIYKVSGPNNRSAAVKSGIYGDHHEPAHEALFSRIGQSSQHRLFPHLYALDYSGAIIQCPYLIREWVCGESLIHKVKVGASDDNYCFFEQMGRALRMIHDLQAPVLGYGLPSEATVHEFMRSEAIPDTIRGQTDSADERYVEPALKNAHELHATGIIDRDIYDDTHALLKKPCPADDSNTILHGDCSPGNFIFRGNVLTGIVDGSAVIGQRYEELAELFLYLSSLALYAPSVSSGTSFSAACSAYDIDVGHLLRHEAFRFFIIVKIVEHLTISLRMERLSHIDLFLPVLGRFL